MTPRFYTVLQLAELWDIDTSTVYRLIHAGKLEARRVTPGNIRISQAAVDAYLDSCERVAK